MYMYIYIYSMSMYGFLDMFMNINNIDSRHLKVNWALTSCSHGQWDDCSVKSDFHKSEWPPAFIYVSMYLRMYVCMYVYVYVYIVYVYVYKYVYVYYAYVWAV